MPDETPPEESHDFSRAEDVNFGLSGLQWFPRTPESGDYTTPLADPQRNDKCVSVSLAGTTAAAYSNTGRRPATGPTDEI